MANNYDDYGYEDDNRNEDSGLTKKIVIVILVIIAIILLIYLLTSCGNRKIDNGGNKNTKFDYEAALLEAGKTYFKNNIDEVPTAPGECNLVDLEALIGKGLLNSSKFGTCNINNTYVRLCILENGTKHYTPWLTCTDKNSESEYAPLKVGTLNDIVVDKTYTEFKYLPQKYNSEGNLGDEEELWKDEIKYEKYKTINSATYYRYRDLLYRWDVTKRSYYTSTGDRESANEVTEYYTVSPASGYNNFDSKTTEAYKWYTTNAVKEYWLKNGSEAWAPQGYNPSEYPYRDPQGVDKTMYRTRNITGTYSPKLYYVCSTSASSSIVVYQTKPCGQGTNTNYTYQKETIYSCADPTSGDDSPRAMEVNSANAVCNKYSAWSSATSTQCDTNNAGLCQKITQTFYKWYKLVDGTERTYWPSNSKTAGGERVYYTEAPVSGAIKDTTTKATAYKWYKETKSRTDSYSAVAPSGYSTATKTNESKWGDWSGWSDKNPKTSDGRERQIETRVKIKLKQIKDGTNDNWENLSNDYLTEEQLIKVFNEKGYENIKTLADITNNGEIRYKLQMSVRNKKGAN